MRRTSQRKPSQSHVNTRKAPIRSSKTQIPTSISAIQLSSISTKTSSIERTLGSNSPHRRLMTTSQLQRSKPSPLIRHQLHMGQGNRNGILEHMGSGSTQSLLSSQPASSQRLGQTPSAPLSLVDDAASDPSFTSCKNNITSLRLPDVSRQIPSFKQPLPSNASVEGGFLHAHTHTSRPQQAPASHSRLLRTSLPDAGLTASSLMSSSPQRLISLSGIYSHTQGQATSSSSSHHHTRVQYAHPTHSPARGLFKRSKKPPNGIKNPLLRSTGPQVVDSVDAIPEDNEELMKDFTEVDETKKRIQHQIETRRGVNKYNNEVIKLKNDIRKYAALLFALIGVYGAYFMSLPNESVTAVADAFPYTELILTSPDIHKPLLQFEKTFSSFMHIDQSFFDRNFDGKHSIGTEASPSKSSIVITASSSSLSTDAPIAINTLDTLSSAIKSKARVMIDTIRDHISTSRSSILRTEKEISEFLQNNSLFIEPWQQVNLRLDQTAGNTLGAQAYRISPDSILHQVIDSPMDRYMPQEQIRVPKNEASALINVYLDQITVTIDRIVTEAAMAYIRDLHIHNEQNPTNTIEIPNMAMLKTFMSDPYLAPITHLRGKVSYFIANEVLFEQSQANRSGSGSRDSISRAGLKRIISNAHAIAYSAFKDAFANGVEPFIERIREKSPDTPIQKYIVLNPDVYDAGGSLRPVRMTDTEMQQYYDRPLELQTAFDSNTDEQLGIVSVIQRNLEARMHTTKM